MIGWLVLIGTLILIPFTVNLRRRFAIALIASVPQLYVLPLQDFHLSVGLVSSLALWPEALKNYKELLRNKILQTAVVIWLFQAISLLWSPELRLGIRTLIYSLPFFLIALTATIVAREQPKLLRIVLGIVVAELVALALLVVAFRLAPDLEMAYLHNEFAGWVTGPNTLKAMLDGTGRNNVFDPAKSGGVFVNANLAAAYLGIGAFLSFKLAGQSHSRWFLIAGTIMLTAVFFPDRRLVPFWL